MRKRLLIVDDRVLDRDLLVQIFEDTYEIELASDGESAVEAVATTRPDLILMDVGLPGLSGANLPIIAVSSRVMPGDRERAIDAGCDDFVAKPIDDVLLVDMVARLLERR